MNSLYRFSFVLFPLSLMAVGLTSLGWIVALGLPWYLLAGEVLLLLVALLVSLRLRGEVERTCSVEATRERVRALEEQERASAVYREKILEDEAQIWEARRQVADEVAQARAMIADRDGEGAARHLTSALELMGDEAYRQCDHPSADVMATVKARACREAGVDPQFSLEIPRGIPISSVDLCAVLGNLVDNGLAGALRARDEGQTPDGASEAAAYVRLRSVVRDGYWVLTAQNPLAKDDRAALARRGFAWLRRDRAVDSHGWGLSIVASIAARYEGSLVVEADDVFRATVVLKLESAREER